MQMLPPLTALHVLQDSEGDVPQAYSVLNVPDHLPPANQSSTVSIGVDCTAASQNGLHADDSAGADPESFQVGSHFSLNHACAFKRSASKRATCFRILLNLTRTYQSLSRTKRAILFLCRLMSLTNNGDRQSFHSKVRSSRGPETWCISAVGPIVWCYWADSSLACFLDQSVHCTFVVNPQHARGCTCFSERRFVNPIGSTMRAVRRSEWQIG